MPQPGPAHRHRQPQFRTATRAAVVLLLCGLLVFAVQPRAPHQLGATGRRGVVALHNVAPHGRANGGQLPAAGPWGGWRQFFGGGRSGDAPVIQGGDSGAAHHHDADHGGGTPREVARGEPRYQLGIDDTGDPGDGGSPCAAREVTAIVMSYPGSRRHHRLAAIISKFLSPAWRTVVAEVVLVWNGRLDQLPPAVTAALEGASSESAGVAGGVATATERRSRGPVLTASGARGDGPVSLIGDPALSAFAADAAVGPVAELVRFGVPVAVAGLGGAPGGCPSVAKAPPPRSALVLGMRANRVDNRWRIGSYVRTAAVLNVDDDIDLSLDGARCMAAVWNAASPLTMVAVDVRAIYSHEERSEAVRAAQGKAAAGGGNELIPKDFERYRDTSTRERFGPYGYGPRHWAPLVRGPAAAAVEGGGGGRVVKRYSIGLPRALVVPRSHLLTYDVMWRGDGSAGSPLRRIVDELECDDIALNFVAANTTPAAAAMAVRADAARCAAAAAGERHRDNNAAAVDHAANVQAPLPILPPGAGAAPLPDDEGARPAGGSVVLAQAAYRSYPEGLAAGSMFDKPGMKAKRQKCANALAALFGGRVLLVQRRWRVVCGNSG